MKEYTVVIQAGGMGSRMREMTGDVIPKPLLRMNGKTLIEWQMENLKEYGFHKFVIITGHLGDKIREFFGDGRDFGAEISYIEEKEPLGSAGALHYLNEMGIHTDIILIYGDVMFCVDWQRALTFHEMAHGKATLFAHPNTHPQDSDLLEMDESGLVTAILSKGDDRKEWVDNCVNAGLYILERTLIASMTEGGRRDLEKDVLTTLIQERRVYAYRTPEYIKDAGTPERFMAVQEEQNRGLWKQKCLKYEQKCVFLDRDGTLNKFKGLLNRIEDFELEIGVTDAVRSLNQSGILAIVVTNQPVVARGMCDLEYVRKIHNKMQTLLGREGAYLDDIVFCPHHPDKGYPEENPLYKVKCHCRKPATGMIMSMVEKYHIDLDKSYMIGDSTVDVMTGMNAGLHTILLETGQGGMDEKYNVEAEQRFCDLKEAVEAIICD